jgi:hypothetical protein
VAHDASHEPKDAFASFGRTSAPAAHSRDGVPQRPPDHRPFALDLRLRQRLPAPALGAHAPLEPALAHHAGLGIATLAAFLITLVTGVLLMFYYKPYPGRAYQSIKDIHFVVPTGRFIRNIHRWAANGMVVRSSCTWPASFTRPRTAGRVNSTGSSAWLCSS